jgi:GNAT superfamily N-acetyltransferase
MKQDQYLKGLSAGAMEYWETQFDVGRYKNIIHLYLIYIPENMRGRHIARLLMNRLCSYADKENCIVTLHPTAGYGSDYTRLCNFYLQLGFVFNTGLDKREDICEVMYRLPQATER